MSNISKVLVIVSSPYYKHDERSNLIHSLCKDFTQVLEERKVDFDSVDLYQPGSFEPIYFPEDNQSLLVENIQNKIDRADLLVFFYPVWWGFLPGILKTFVEKTFTKGFAYRHERKKIYPKLTQKKMLVICTSVKSSWYYRLTLRNANYFFFKRVLNEKTGLKLAKFIEFSNIRIVKEKKIQRWRDEIKRLAERI